MSLARSSNRGLSIGGHSVGMAQLNAEGRAITHEIRQTEVQTLGVISGTKKTYLKIAQVKQAIAGVQLSMAQTQLDGLQVQAQQTATLIDLANASREIAIAVKTHTVEAARAAAAYKIGGL